MNAPELKDKMNELQTQKSVLQEQLYAAQCMPGAKGKSLTEIINEFTQVAACSTCRRFISEPS